MFHDILHFFDHRSMSLGFFFFPILLIILQTALWDWQTNKQLSRRNMFFGARVGPEFIASVRGDSILKRFRLRIWFLRRNLFRIESPRTEAINSGPTRAQIRRAHV